MSSTQDPDLPPKEERVLLDLLMLRGALLAVTGLIISIVFCDGFSGFISIGSTFLECGIALYAIDYWISDYFISKPYHYFVIALIAYAACVYLFIKYMDPLMAAM